MYLHSALCQCQCQCQSKIFSVVIIAKLLRRPRGRSVIKAQCQEKTGEKEVFSDVDGRQREKKMLGCRMVGIYHFCHIYCACAETETVISEFPVKILTSPLDAATPISIKGNNHSAIRRRFEVFYYHAATGGLFHARPASDLECAVSLRELMLCWKNECGSEL